MLLGASILVAILLSPLVMLASVAAVIVVGVVWSPFGAAVCWIAARRRGLSPTRYALFGALYSALLLVPWLYLLQRLRRRGLPRNLVVVCYWFLFAGIWGFGGICNAGFWILWELFALLTKYYGPLSLVRSEEEVEFFMLAAMITILLGNVAALTFSVRRLRRISRVERPTPTTVDRSPESELLLNRDYIIPIAYALVGSALGVVTVLVDAQL